MTTHRFPSFNPPSPSLAQAGRRMRGKCAANYVELARGQKALLYSSSATSLLGPNLSDVWTVAAGSHSAASRSTSSDNCRSARPWPRVAKILDGNSIAREIRSGIACEVQRMKEFGKSLGLAIVVQLDEERIIDIVSPEKDVDGFHPMNMGNLAMRGREPLFIPCAPKSCIKLLLRSGVKIMGKRAVVVGRSKIVGLPISLLLQRHHATVSTVHAFTKNLEQITREADIVVADVGIPSIVHGSWLKPGAVVVDMGTS